jgi:hypothetical protein
VEFVVSGDDHLYERFAPQDPQGFYDPAGGVRQFVVGTGGAKLRPFADTPHPNSEVRIGNAYGVLHLRLSESGYAWSFVAQPGNPGNDAGRQSCT